MNLLKKFNSEHERFLFNQIQISKHIFFIWFFLFILLLDIDLATSPGVNFTGCITVTFWSILLLFTGCILLRDRSFTGRFLYWTYSIFWGLMIIFSILLRGYCKADKRPISNLDYTAFAGTGGIEVKEFLQYKGMAILQNILFPAAVFIIFTVYIYIYIFMLILTFSENSMQV